MSNTSEDPKDRVQSEEYAMRMDEKRDLTLDELNAVAAGCCCGMPGCSCGPEIHTDLVPNLYPMDLTNYKPFLIVRELCN